MITIKDINNAPAILNEKDRDFAFQRLDALKGLHVSSTGYSIAEGEEIYFPTMEQIAANPNKFLKVGVTQKGSSNKVALIRVNRKAPGSDEVYDGWLNVSVLSRKAYDKNGNQIDIDQFREEMSAREDDFDRVFSCIGKKIVGIGILSAYAPKYIDHKPARDSNGRRIYEPADYVKIDLFDIREIITPESLNGYDIDIYQVRSFMGRKGISDYEIKKDRAGRILGVAVGCDIYIQKEDLINGQIPFKFFSTRSFICINLGLTTLKNSPDYILGDFACSQNKLKSLAFGPKSVYGYFACDDNDLTSLEYCARIDDCEGFYCAGNRLTSLEYCPKIIYGSFDCSNNCLYSLENGPIEVRGYYNCGGNLLHDLVGAPASVGTTFDCSRNPLRSLDGCPTSIGQYFVATGCGRYITLNEQILKDRGVKAQGYDL